LIHAIDPTPTFSQLAIRRSMISTALNRSPSTSYARTRASSASLATPIGRRAGPDAGLRRSSLD
jgi:hypothetical protein